MQPCNLFISIPFVVGAADWSDEPLYPNTPPAVKRAYLEALLAEMRGFASDAATLDIASVTFGTGSLSTIPEADLRDFLTEVQAVFDIGSRQTPVYARFDPGLLSIGQARALSAFGSPWIEFRYLASNFDEAAVLGVPSGETEMKKTAILLEQAGLDNVIVRIALGVHGQTSATLEKSLRDALRSTVKGFELVPLRKGWPGAQDDDDTALLLNHAQNWLEDHGFHATTPLRFMRENVEDLYCGNLYAPIGDSERPATISFGPSTLSAFDGLIWSNAGDINRYIRESADPEAITEQAAHLDAAAAAQRHAFDTLYRCGAIPFDGIVHASLLEEGMLVRDASAPDGRGATVRLSSKGRLRSAQVFERLSRADA